METLTIDLKKKKSFEIGQQGDHNALCIHFINMKNVGTNKKYIYYTIDGIENCVPLTNDRFIVGYPLTAHSGIASAQLISKLNDNSIIKLSNVFAMNIKESKGYKDSGEYPVDPNIQSSYDLLDDLIDQTQDLINNYNYATLMEKLTQASSEATTSANTAKKCADELKSSTDFINTLDDKVAAQDSKIEKIEASTSHITTKQNTKIAALQTRMSEFTSLKDGSTTGDAELIDARIGADGTKYPSAGDAMRGQVEQLNEVLVDVNDNLNNIGNLIFKVVDGYYLAPKDVGEKIEPRVNIEYSYSVAKVKNLEKISVTAIGTPSFSFFTNEKDIVVQKGIDFAYSNNDKTINVPQNATYYYSCHNTPKNKNLVVVKGGVVPSPFDIINKPVGLQINQVKKVDISDSINAVSGYDNLSDDSKIKLDIGTFGDASIAGNIISVNSVNGGFATNDFTSNTSKLMILLDCDFEFSKLAINIRINKNDDTFTLKTIKVTTKQGLQEPVYFDCSSEIIYNDAKSFEIIVNCNDGDKNSGTLIVKQFTVRELNEWKLNTLYDSSFDKLMNNVFNAIDEKATDTSTDLVLSNENGKKFSLSVVGNTLTLIANVPNKTLFIGNSLLLGMDTNGAKGGAFGMCATDYTKDYAYHVENAILNKNSTATFNKLHIAEFEQSETLEQARNYIESNKSQFTEDTDLIILQLGDNVNNDTRRNVFKTSFIELLKAIRNNSQKARVIVCGIWFTSDTYDTLMQCTNYGCELVDIRSLNIKVNQGTAGETITYKNGSTEPLPSAWTTHAGNKGMELIAKAILEKVNM